MFIPSDRPIGLDRRKKGLLFLLVVLFHLAILWWFAMMRFMGPPSAPPVFEVILFSPGGGGGGRPAASADASTASATPAATLPLHVPKNPQPWVDTPPAPVPSETAEVLTPAAALPVVGLSSEVTVDNARTQGDGGAGSGAGGGVGTGSGTGIGPGSGAGRGDGRDGRPRFIRGPAGAVMSQNVTSAELARVSNHYAVFRCAIQANGRATQCRLLSEAPPGANVANAARERIKEMRWAPAVYRRPYREVIAVSLPGPSATEPGVDGT